MDDKVTAIPVVVGTWFGTPELLHKRRGKKKRLVQHPARGLNPDKHTIQEAHDAPWIGARGSNTGPGLTTQEVHSCASAVVGRTILCVFYLTRAFRFEIGPYICGPVAGYLLSRAQLVLLNILFSYFRFSFSFFLFAPFCSTRI